MSEATDNPKANEELPLREYVGFIWIGDNPGIRLSLWARSGSEAQSMLEEEYGTGHVFSLWNEADARKPR